MHLCGKIAHESSASCRYFRGLGYIYFYSVAKMEHFVTLEPKIDKLYEKVNAVNATSFLEKCVNYIVNTIKILNTISKSDTFPANLTLKYQCLQSK